MTTHEVFVGDKVRSFDFDFDSRDLSGDRACYIEGRVEAIVCQGASFPVDGTMMRFNDCDRYIIRVGRQVFGGAPQFEHPNYVFPPVNGTPTLDSSTNCVERME